MKARGFTLLEVLIAMSLFSIIALATVKQITLIKNTKDAVFEESEMYNGLRAAISLMRNDLQQTFHILYDELGEDNMAALAKNQPAPHTVFDGRKKEIIFTSLSHRVYYDNKRECEQTEISYFLQTKKGNKLPTLMKRESERIDSEVYQGGKTYTILEGITSLEFQYWDDKQGKWIDDWNSDSGSYRDRFPFAVKIKMTVTDARQKQVKIETSFKIAFPNNEGFTTQL